jgi:hypothetical protein
MGTPVECQSRALKEDHLDTTSETSLDRGSNKGESVSDQGKSFKETIRQALTSKSFVEKFAEVLLTAALVATLAPLIISYFDSKASERQKAIEAETARTNAILQAQSKLLDEVAATVLAYETLAVDVSWYKQPRAANDEMHRKAFARYSERIVDLVARWRALISRSRTLASPEVSDKLDKFLTRIFVEQDTPMLELVTKNASESEWADMHKKSEALLVQANALIAELATDMKLSKAHLQP